MEGPVGNDQQGGPGLDTAGIQVFEDWSLLVSRSRSNRMEPTRRGVSEANVGPGRWTMAPVTVFWLLPGPDIQFSAIGLMLEWIYF